VKTVSILIPNYNSFEAVQLCIESVRKYTKYPCRIIVHDSGSDNKRDLEYLRKAQAAGWIELIEAGAPKPHGEALNFLLNERCKNEFDYAVVLDDDIYIKEEGWLEDMLKEVKKDKVLAVCDYQEDWHYYHSDFYEVWFSVFDLAAYRDGMQIDWNTSCGDLREEPYKSMKRGMVPTGAEAPKEGSFPSPNIIINDVGAKLLIKILNENPKGYKVAPLPEEVKRKYKHWGTMSRSTAKIVPENIRLAATEELQKKSDEINKALREIRI